MDIDIHYLDSDKKLKQPMDNSEDLPLSSNHEHFEVDHYIIELHCDMRRRIFSGGLTLQVSLGSQWAGETVLVLDCSDIDVETVEMISSDNSPGGRSFQQRCLMGILYQELSWGTQSTVGVSR